MTSRRAGTGGPPLTTSAALAVVLSMGVLAEARVAAAAEKLRSVYVSSERSGRVAAVGGGSLQVLRQIDVGDRPHNVGMTPDGLLVIATQGADTVAVMDTTRAQAALRRYPIGAPPHSVAVGGDGRTVFVVSERGAFVRLDPATGRVLQRIDLEGSPHNMIASGKSAWITDVSARRLLIVDGDNRVEASPISIVGHDLAVRPASAELWVTPWNNSRVVVVDLKTRREIARFDVGRDPSHKHVTFTEDGNEAWITEPSSGNVFVVDAQTRRLIKAVDLGGPPHHVRIAAGRAYIAVGPGELVVLDAGSRTVVGRRAVGRGVHDLGVGRAVD